MGVKRQAEASRATHGGLVLDVTYYYKNLGRILSRDQGQACIFKYQTGQDGDWLGERQNWKEGAHAEAISEIQARDNSRLN